MPSTVSQPTACSPCLMSVRMSHSAGFLTFLSTYAPTHDKSPEDKDAFYAHISEVIYSVPAGDDLALLEDFNARVGGDVIAWRPFLGHFGIGSINDNGQCLLELCAAHGLCLPGSFPSGPIRSKVTWMYPRSKHWHQLDHIIVRRRQINAVKRYRSMHSADCDTDHALVHCTLKLTLKKIHSATPKLTPKLNTELMWKHECVARFCARMEGLHFRVDDTPENTWAEIKGSMTEAASKVFGLCRRKHLD